MIRFAIAAALSLPAVTYAQGNARPDPTVPDAAALAQTAEQHARQRDSLLGLLALALAVGFAFHWNGTRRIQRLESDSLSDPLTGVKNRRYLEDTIDMDIAASLRAHRSAAKARVAPHNADLVFMVVDLDNFKRINDQYGHEAGDRALTAVARALGETCRDADLLVRWGGDEFLVVQRFTDRHDAAVAADRFRHAVEHARVDIGHGVEERLTCSVGYAAFPFRLDNFNALSWQEIITIADLAAYSAKRDGRNASAGYVWNDGVAIVMHEVPAVSDPHTLLRIGLLRRETNGARAHVSPEQAVGTGDRPQLLSRQTQPRMRLNLM